MVENYLLLYRINANIERKRTPRCQGAPGHTLFFARNIQGWCNLQSGAKYISCKILVQAGAKRGFCVKVGGKPKAEASSRTSAQTGPRQRISPENSRKPLFLEVFCSSPLSEFVSNVTS